MPGEPTPLFSTDTLDTPPYISILGTDYPLANGGRAGIRANRRMMKVLALIKDVNLLDTDIPDEEAESTITELFGFIRSRVEGMTDAILDNLSPKELYDLAGRLSEQAVDFTHQGNQTDGEAVALTEPISTNGQHSPMPLNLPIISLDTVTMSG